MQRKKKKIEAFDVVNCIILSLLSLTMVYPFINMFFISVSEMADVVESGGMILWPKSFSWEAYEYVFKYAQIVKPLIVTVFVTIVSTALHLLFTGLAGYILSDINIPGRKWMTTYLVIPMFYGGGLIPIYLLYKYLGIMNTVWVLIIPGATSTWNICLARNFFMSLPYELRESARIDGASELKIMFGIVFPLALPIFATLGLFKAVSAWNIYMDAVLFINNPNLQTLQVAIRRMYESTIQEFDIDKLPPVQETVRSATVMICTLPIIIVYPFVQKYFVKGVMVGSIKG